MKINGNLEISEDALADFCHRWRITELAVFGSVLTEQFRPDSDADVIVTFEPDTRWTLFDIVQMEDELAHVFGRDVDLSEKSAVEKSENYIRRRNILKSAQTIYGA